MNPISDSLTNVFLDGEACPDSVLDVSLTSQETVTKVMRDGLINSCVEPKTLAQNNFRLLVPSPDGLHRIQVWGRGFLSCNPIYGLVVYGVNGCYDDVPCELRMCTAHEPNKQSRGIVCSFSCPRNNYRYALLDIRNHALNNMICEIDIF